MHAYYIYIINYIYILINLGWTIRGDFSEKSETLALRHSTVTDGNGLLIVNGKTYTMNIEKECAI